MILFLRQFAIQKYKTSHRYTSQPNLPDNVNDLNSLLESVNYFKFCLNETIKDKAFLKEIEYDLILTNEFENIDKFVFDLESNIKEKIGIVKLKADISEEKVNDFLNSSEKIINESITKYLPLNNANGFEEKDDDLKFYIKGSMTLMSKSAFTVDDIPHLNYDSVFAQSIVSNQIERYIPSSFISARTERYLLNRNNLVNGLSSIIKNNKEHPVIIVFNATWQTRKILEESQLKKHLTFYPSTQFKMQDFIYVLHKKDLPQINFRSPTEVEKQELKLKGLSKFGGHFNIYGSVIDINLPENKLIKEKYIDHDSLNKATELQILLIISFLIELRFTASNRKILQINVNTEFDELGSESELSDLKEF